MTLLLPPVDRVLVKKIYIPSPLCDEDIGISMLDAKYLESPASSVLSNQISLLVGWNQFSPSRPAAFDIVVGE